MPSLQRLSNEHLALAFGDALGPAERRRIARESVLNIARVFCEIAKFDTIAERLDDYVRFDDTAILEDLVRTGRGAVVVTGHIGNWEMLAAYFAHRGIEISAVARRIYDERLNALLVDFRARNGVGTILREDKGSARQIIAALKGHSVLAMLIDQDTHAPSVSVPFFGHPARTPVAPARLALRRNVPLHAVFIERRSEGGHRITLSPPISLPHTGDQLEDTRRLTAVLNQAIETQIRHRPEEWVWWHDRWRRRPIPHLDLDAELQYSPGLGASEAACAQNGTD